jgi:hypothetical protein
VLFCACLRVASRSPSVRITTPFPSQESTIASPGWQAPRFRLAQNCSKWVQVVCSV